MKLLRRLLVFAWIFPALSLAAIQGSAGPYRIDLATQPNVVPVGAARLVLEVRDAQGKPLDGLEVKTLTGMPGMFMGEREQRATPVPGKPGTYSTQAAFPMAGAYEVKVSVSGAPGVASTSIAVSTGQATGGQAQGFSISAFLPWIFGLALVAYVVVRLRATGQGLNWKAMFNRTTLGGIALLAALWLVAVFAVNRFRREGAMTPIEAQVMEMNTPAPPGTFAVELATVERRAVAETVRYSGQAVGFVEQDINARTTGVVVAMANYVGDKVKKGQVLARLDTSQLDPQLAERAAMTAMAAEGVGVAASEYEAALQEVAEARAEVRVREGGIDEAEAMLEAARQEKIAAAAEAEAMAGEVSRAEAEVEAARSAEVFQSVELDRTRQLFNKGAASKSELQQAEAMAAEATAELHHAQSMVVSAKAKLAASKAAVKKAEAMAAAAQRRVRQSRAEVQAAKAAVLSKQKAADAMKRAVGRERAAVEQAKAGYQSAAAQRGFASLKAEVDGVITERLVSPGTLVNPGQTVFKVAQVSPIRLQANVSASDLERIRVGTKATIRIGASESVHARVTSVAPAVDSTSRTGVVEVLWPNEPRKFSPGQFLTLDIEIGSAQPALAVPTFALQRPIGAGKPFVWVAQPTAEGSRFTVRRAEVVIGSNDGKLVAVKEGLSQGQQVVVKGGANLREGSEVTAAMPKLAANVVEVFATGYKPSSIEAKQGEPITITFIRRSEEGCGTEIVLPDFKINKPLPLNHPVEVSITPTKVGEFRFSCGMDMYNGKVVVR